MRTSTAAVGSAAFFVAAPGTVVGLGPWLITHWEVPGSSPPLRVVLGVVLIVLGLIPPIHAFIQFAKAGGTPMPAAPTERLVVAGFNRFVRNPMYFGMGLVLIGEAIVFPNITLLILGLTAALFLFVTAFVIVYEEPTLRRTFGTDYEAYCRAVRRWIPRLRPWYSAAHLE